ncbi:hypothetical protein RQP46_006795 [Phenoliferia psychrophenolica]
MWSTFLQWLRSLFWTKSLEVALIGLQNSGKTSLVNVLVNPGEFSDEMIPTVGFNLRKVTKGNVTIKLWDIGGQPRFRSMWERYCRGVNAVLFIVDSADPGTFEAARSELHALLAKPELRGIPLLVLANKNDIEGHTKVEEVIEDLHLAKILDREVSCYSISASLVVCLALATLGLASPIPVVPVQKELKVRQGFVIGEPGFTPIRHHAAEAPTATASDAVKRGRQGFIIGENGSFTPIRHDVEAPAETVAA